jgi:hypothetical protein
MRLLLLEFGEQQCVPTGLGQFREMVLQASLDLSAAGLNAGASLLGVGFAGFGYGHITDQRSLAGRRKLAEMLFDTRFESALARFDFTAQLPDVRCACLTGGALLGHCASWHQQQE